MASPAAIRNSRDPRGEGCTVPPCTCLGRRGRVIRRRRRRPGVMLIRRGSTSGKLVFRGVARPFIGPRVLGMADSHPEVDAYIQRLPVWQQEICEQLRRVIREADPDIEETIKRSVQPYFVLNGNVCALLATKDHINLFLYDPTVADPEGLINQGYGNATARAIQIYEGDAIRSPALTELLRGIVANNRAGGWRRLRKPGL